MREQRSLFFPMAMIAAGVIWLLSAMRIIPAENLWALTYLLPYLLMALGAGLILRAWWPPAGMVVSAVVVIGAVLAVVYAPQLGWARVPAWGFGRDFGGALTGSGVVETEERPARDFLVVSVEYPAEVIIRQGESESVTVAAEDNLLPQLSTEIVNGVLVIRNSERNWGKRVNPTEPVKITVMVRDLRAVDFLSAGSVRVENLETEELNVTLSGAGEVTLAGLQVRRLECDLNGAGSIHADGVADEVEIRIDGFGSFYGDELFSMTADVQINGAGSANLQVKNYLEAEINGAGSIGYYGTPEVNQHINGAGDVRRLQK